MIGCNVRTDWTRRCSRPFAASSMCSLHSVCASRTLAADLALRTRSTIAILRTRMFLKRKVWVSRKNIRRGGGYGVAEKEIKFFRIWRVLTYWGNHATWFVDYLYGFIDVFQVPNLEFTSLVEGLGAYEQILFVPTSSECDIDHPVIRSVSEFILLNLERVIAYVNTFSFGSLALLRPMSMSHTNTLQKP